MKLAIKSFKKNNIESFVIFVDENAQAILNESTKTPFFSTMVPI
jgi:hypothetical protein